jgi:hypothetical protein
MANSLTFFPLIMFLVLLITQNVVTLISDSMLRFSLSLSTLAFAQSRTTTESLFLSGQINSMVTLSPMARSVIAGDWSVDIIGGNVTSFSANITNAPSNGTRFESYQLTNFLKASGEPIRLDNNQSTSIVGTIDITSNDQMIQQHVPANITIANGLIMSIALDPNSISSSISFAREPIYGLVRSLVERTSTSID